MPVLAQRLETALRQLIGEGCRYFGAGGALALTPLPPRLSSACGRSSLISG